MRIGATFTFEAAHRLPNLPEGHKCRNLHGHNYQLDVTIEGKLDECGFVMDYAELEEIVGPIVQRVDHRYLNDVEGLENPTSEIMLEWFMARIKPRIAAPVTLRLYETNRYWAELSA